MRYIISYKDVTYHDHYVYRTWPYFQWTDDKILALRMHLELASDISRTLMGKGISHTITPIKD